MSSVEAAGEFASTDKFAKALLKKLRQVEELEQKRDSLGHRFQLKPAQLEKIAKKADILSQLVKDCGLNEKKIAEMNATVPKAQNGAERSGGKRAKGGRRSWKSAKGSGGEDITNAPGGTATKRPAESDTWSAHASKRPRLDGDGSWTRHTRGGQWGSQQQLETAHSATAILSLAANASLEMSASTAAHILHKLSTCVCSANTSKPGDSESDYAVTKSSNGSMDFDSPNFAAAFRRIGQFASSMNGKQLCKAVYGLGKLVDRKFGIASGNIDAGLSPIASLAADLCTQGIDPALQKPVKSFDVRALATIIWGLAKLKDGKCYHCADTNNSIGTGITSLQTGLVSAFMSANQTQKSHGSDSPLSKCTPADCAMAVWGLAKLKWFLAKDDLEKIQTQVCRACDTARSEAYKNHHHRIKAQEVSMLVWSCATLSTLHSSDANGIALRAETVRSLLTASTSCLSELEPRGLANVMWAMGKILLGFTSGRSETESVATQDVFPSAEARHFQRAVRSRLENLAQEKSSAMNGSGTNGAATLSPQGLAQVALGAVRILLQDGEARDSTKTKTVSESVLRLIAEVMQAHLPKVKPDSSHVTVAAPKISDAGDLARALAMALHHANAMLHSDALQSGGDCIPDSAAKVSNVVTALSEVVCWLRDVCKSEERALMWQCVGHVEFLSRELICFQGCLDNMSESVKAADTGPRCTDSKDFKRSRKLLKRVSEALDAEVLQSPVVQEVLETVQEQRSSKCEQAIKALIQAKPWDTVGRPHATLLVDDHNAMMRTALVTSSASCTSLGSEHTITIHAWTRFCRTGADVTAAEKKAEVATEILGQAEPPPAPGPESKYGMILMRIPPYSKEAALHSVRMCAAHLAGKSGSLFLCGHVCEGTLALPGLLRELFEEVSIMTLPVPSSVMPSSDTTEALSGSVRLISARSAKQLSLLPLALNTEGGQTDTCKILKESESRVKMSSSLFVDAIRSRGSGEAANLVSFPWVSYPGMFAGGSLTEMTTFFLQNVLGSTAPNGLAFAVPNYEDMWVLDLCSGSGCVGAAVLFWHFLRNRSESSESPHQHRLTLHSADADALSIRACRKNLRQILKVLDKNTTTDKESESGSTKTIGAVEKNLPTTLEFFNSDVFSGIPTREEERKLKYDVILSNPPVHNGSQTDFSVVLRLLDGARKRLRRTGILYIVLQEYIPLRSLLRWRESQMNVVRSRQPFYSSVEARACDGKYTVWELKK